MYEFKLPDLGEGIHEAEIIKWYVAPGGRIEEDEPLVDVETDKAAVTIPSPKGGAVVSLTGEPGDIIVVGQVVAVIDETGEGALVSDQPSVSAVAAAPEQPAEVRAGGSGGSVSTAPAEPPPAVPAASIGERPPAAPATRRLARELGVDINLVTPTGPAGRVTPEDVRAYADGSQRQTVAAPPPAELMAAASEPGADSPADPALAEAAKLAGIPFYDLEPMPDFERFGPVEREPIRSIRRKIARKMVTSLVVVPHVIHMDEADVTALEAFRLRHREKNPDGPKLSLLAFVVKAITAGLRRAPMFNASLDPDRNEIVYKKFYNIGLAADTPKGLIVPVVHGADSKSVLDVAREIGELAGRARAGEIELASLQGGTFTVTNIGPLGGIALAPAINYPEVAILGMGKVQEKPVVRDGEIVIRKILPLTLSFDHRVADGADAARFISFVVRLLSDPENMLLEV